jgi:hypothetical protein
LIDAFNAIAHNTLKEKDRDNIKADSVSNRIKIFRKYALFDD